MKTKQLSLLPLLVALTGACGGGDNEEPLTFDEFFSALPDAVCDYYLSCDQITEAERPECPSQLFDDLERDYSCNGARGLFPQLESGLRVCINGEPKPCQATDDLDLFCPSLSLLESECVP